jgi:uncharacterized protein (DUF885 family)
MKNTIAHRLALLSLLAGIAAAPSHADPSQQLRTLYERAWQQDLKSDPLLASQQGDPRYNALWPDVSIKALTAIHDDDVAVLAELRRFDRSALLPVEQLNYDLFEREYAQRLRTWPFKPYLYEINHQGGIQTLSETAELLPFQSLRDYQDWIARLRAVGSYVDQNIELLRIGAREKRTQPRVIMQRIPVQLALQVVARPEDSPFYEPFKRMPEAIPAADRERLAAAGRAAIAEVVVPAYRRLQQHFNEKYLPATRASIGISDTPQGADFYRERIAYHTTVGSLTADQIHQIGLGEVARIRGEMLAIIAKVGFKGSLQEFFGYLRTDPKFYYATGAELYEAYLATAKRIDPALSSMFGKLPRTPYGVRPIPMTSAPNTTTAYYQPLAADGTRPGYYYVNLYRPEVRPKWEMEVLSMHEAVPGHHLQIALAMEQPDMPMFRRNAGYTAYVEGWALYSESLGEEMGMYQDPYSKFGQLTYDMWRAVRLVVDTGIHAQGWTRQQAIGYFMDNAPKTEADITNEVDRYISWPGQALAYKIGQLRIRALREEATQRLGARFDIRKFHDAVLATGAVPLDTLEVSVREWLRTQ